jgi:hypothetical protein
MYPSTQKLVSALEGEYLLTGDQRLKSVIFKAKSDYYHDFFGELAMPEVELYDFFMATGHVKLAKRVKNGDFDATKEESDEWAKSSEGQSIFKEILNNAKAKKNKDS